MGVFYLVDGKPVGTKAHMADHTGLPTDPGFDERITSIGAIAEDSSKSIKTLSYDWSGIKNLVASLYPAGNTNQGTGIAHGWISLVGGGPYPMPPAEDPNFRYTKAVVLMSDGPNTEDRWYSNQNQVDRREALTCSDAKAAGIVVYTVQVNTGGDPTSNVLKDCASGPDKFTEIKSANQLVATFNSIGTALSNLRIAQ